MRKAPGFLCYMNNPHSQSESEPSNVNVIEFEVVSVPLGILVPVLVSVAEVIMVSSTVGS